MQETKQRTTTWNISHSGKYDVTVLRKMTLDTLVDSDSLRVGRSGNRIPVEARYSAPVQTGPGAHPASYTIGTGSLSRGWSGQGVTNTHPHLAPRLKKEYSYTSTPPLGRQGLFYGELYLYSSRLTSTFQTNVSSQIIIISTKNRVFLNVTSRKLLDNC